MTLLAVVTGVLCVALATAIAYRVIVSVIEAELEKMEIELEDDE